MVFSLWCLEDQFLRLCALSLLQWQSQDKEGHRQAVIGTKQAVSAAAATSSPRRCGPKGGLSWRTVAVWPGLFSVHRVAGLRRFET